MLAPALVLSLISTAHAFTTTAQFFTFPNIPLDLGIRHIHTPETYEISHKLSFPHFELVDVSEPYTVGNHAVIHFRFRTLLGERVAHMFTNDRCVSHVLINDIASNQHILTTFSVVRDGMFGHKLRVKSQVITPTTDIAYPSTYCISGFGPVVLSSEHVADAIREGYRAKHENPYLLEYRRMVLFGQNEQ
jgi:hypothetical protein